MEDLIKAALTASLSTVEKFIEGIKAADAFLHETVDGYLHRTLAYWEAVAARIRSELGIAAGANDDEAPASVRAAAVDFVDAIKAGCKTE